MFWVSLIKTASDNQFLKDNCTHIEGEYYIYEGDLFLLDDEDIHHEVLARGGVPSLGGLNKEELKRVVLDYLGVEW